MCGRYAASRRPEDLVEEFEIDFTQGQGPGDDPATAEPDWNVAPTKTAPVVLARVPREPAEPDDPPPSAADEDGEATADAAGADAAAAAEEASREPVRWLRLLRWGLVPSWADGPSVGARMINARAESLLDKPAFRRAALSRRCLVPADGWYEWQASPTAQDAKGRPRKQPFYMSPLDGGPLAFAGLYEFWRDRAAHPDDPTAWLTTFTIVTTAAEEGLARVHDRMPLALPRDRWQDWLDPELGDPDDVRALLAPPVAGRFSAVPVSTRVNAARENGPDLVTPLGADALHGVVDPSTGEIVGAGDTPLF